MEEHFHESISNLKKPIITIADRSDSYERPKTSLPLDYEERNIGYTSKDFDNYKRMSLSDAIKKKPHLKPRLRFNGSRLANSIE